MIKLDNRDMQILSILQSDGRITKSELAARINLSPAPCWERLKRLEQAGIIEGYNAKLSPKAFGPLSVIFMQIELSSNNKDVINVFEDKISKTPEVVECWSVCGGIDYMLKIICKDIICYDRIVKKIIDEDVGIHKYFAYIVIKAVKNSPYLPISDLKNIV